MSERARETVARADRYDTYTAGSFGLWAQSNLKSHKKLATIDCFTLYTFPRACTGRLAAQSASISFNSPRVSARRIAVFPVIAPQPFFHLL